MRCPRCGAAVHQTDRFCSKCGTDSSKDVEVFNYCPSCRENRSLTTNYCTKCGARLQRIED